MDEKNKIFDTAKGKEDFKTFEDFVVYCKDVAKFLYKLFISEKKKNGGW